MIPFDCDAIQNIASGFNAFPAAMSAKPTASTESTLSLSATSATRDRASSCLSTKGWSSGGGGSGRLGEQGCRQGERGDEWDECVGGFHSEEISDHVGAVVADNEKVTLDGYCGFVTCSRMKRRGCAGSVVR